MAHVSISCQSCGALQHTGFSQAQLLCCSSCGELIDVNVPTTKTNIKSGVMPEDWGFIQIGTTGIFKDENFSVVGRVRLQLRNDYKNFWCAQLQSGAYIWIRESFASFAVLRPVWREYDDEVSKLHANNSIEILETVKITGDFVEKCESISFEGACGKWPMQTCGFFYIEGGNAASDVASFFIVPGQRPVFLAGRRIEWESLQLKNIVEWNEWK